MIFPTIYDNTSQIVQDPGFVSNRYENFSAKAGYRGATAGLHVIERFRRTETNTVHYELTVEDPTTFSRPWTAALDLKRIRVRCRRPSTRATKATTRCSTS